MLAVTQVVFSLNNSATLFPSSESNNCLFTDGLKHHSNIRGSIQRTQASKPPTSALLCHFYQHQKASKEESVPLGHSKSHWRFEMSATSEPAPRGYASSPAPHTSPRPLSARPRAGAPRQAPWQRCHPCTPSTKGALCAWRGTSVSDSLFHQQGGTRMRLSHLPNRSIRGTPRV